MSLGGQMLMVAVGWDIYERTRSTTALGLVGLVLMIPVLLLSLPAGQVIDRVNRRTVILAASGLHVVAAAGLTAFTWYGADVQWTYLVLLVTGIARAFQYPAHSAMVPQIVPPELFPNAVTWSANSFYLAAALGPALGGFVIAWTGGVFWIYASAIGAHAVFLLAVWSIERPPTPRDTSGVKGWAALSAGLTYVRRTPMILAPITLDMFAVILGGCTTLLPVFARDILEVGPTGLGWLRAAPSIGGVVGALVIATLPPFQRAGRALLWGVVGFGAATVGFGLSKNFALSLAFLFLMGATDMISVVIRQTLIQMLTPDAMRGRVSAVNSVFIGASNELGGFESGITATWFGTVASVAGGGVGTLLVALGAAWFWPELRKFGALPVPVTPEKESEHADET